MNDTGRMALFLASERRRGDWRDADERRRIDRRPDTPPMPAAEPHGHRPALRFLRLLPRHG
jgi:hypothetical protein